MDYLDRYACEFGIHSTITSTFVVCELINQRACTFFWSSINGWMPMLADWSSKAHTSIFFAGLYEFLEHQWNYDALWIFIIYLNQRRGRKLYHQTVHNFPFLSSYFFYLSPPSISLWIFYSFISLLAMIFPTGRSLVMPWKISVWFAFVMASKICWLLPAFPN